MRNILGRPKAELHKGLNTREEAEIQDFSQDGLVGPIRVIVEKGVTTTLSKPAKNSMLDVLHMRNLYDIQTDIQCTVNYTKFRRKTRIADDQFTTPSPSQRWLQPCEWMALSREILKSGKITKDTTLEKTADFKIQAEVANPRKETEKSTLRNSTLAIQGEEFKKADKGRCSRNVREAKDEGVWFAKH